MKKPGCGPVAGIIVVLVIILIFGGNEAVGYYFSECEGDDESMLACLMGVFEDEEEPEEGAVVATGTYTYKGYDVNITMNIPLEGGNVTGSVSGTCDGSVKASFDGQNNGVIRGKLSGTCDPFFVKIPAGAEFSGTVNKTGKTVPISFQGRGGGITHNGSMALGYQ